MCGKYAGGVVDPYALEDPPDELCFYDEACGAAWSDYHSWQHPTSAPAVMPPQGALGGSGRPSTPMGEREVGPLGAPPLPRVLEPFASRVADSTALGRLGDDPEHPDHLGGVGCNAGGKGQRCRFCGFAPFAACPDGAAPSPPSPPPPGATAPHGATAGAFFEPGLDKPLVQLLRAQLLYPKPVLPSPAALFAPGRWHANSSATLTGCADRIKTGWTPRRDLVGRCARTGTCKPS